VRLAPFVFDGKVSHDAGLWVEWARVPRVDELVVEEGTLIVGVLIAIGVMDEVAEPIVAAVNIAHGAAGAGDAALVGDDDDGVSGIFERDECIGHARDEECELRLEQIAPLDSRPCFIGEISVAIDRVVAVEEDRRAE